MPKLALVGIMKNNEILNQVFRKSNFLLRAKSAVTLIFLGWSITLVGKSICGFRSKVDDSKMQSERSLSFNLNVRHSTGPSTFIPRVDLSIFNPIMDIQRQKWMASERVLFQTNENGRSSSLCIFHCRVFALAKPCESFRFEGRPLS